MLIISRDRCSFCWASGVFYSFPYKEKPLSHCLFILTIPRNISYMQKQHLSSQQRCTRSFYVYVTCLEHQLFTCFEKLSVTTGSHSSFPVGKFCEFIICFHFIERLHSWKHRAGNKTQELWPPVICCNSYALQMLETAHNRVNGSFQYTSCIIDWWSIISNQWRKLGQLRFTILINYTLEKKT